MILPNVSTAPGPFFPAFSSTLNAPHVLSSVWPAVSLRPKCTSGLFARGSCHFGAWRYGLHGEAHPQQEGAHVIRPRMFLLHVAPLSRKIQLNYIPPIEHIIDVGRMGNVQRAAGLCCAWNWRRALGSSVFRFLLLRPWYRGPLRPIGGAALRRPLCSIDPVSALAFDPEVMLEIPRSCRRSIRVGLQSHPGLPWRHR
jgi:hypothetical protein